MLRFVCVVRKNAINYIIQVIAEQSEKIVITMIITMANLIS